MAKKPSDEKAKIVEQIRLGILKAARHFRLPPHTINLAQFWAASKTQSWNTKRFGGFYDIRDMLFKRAAELSSETRVKISDRIATIVAQGDEYKLTNPLLQYFNLETIDLKALFKQAGLPTDDVMKMVVLPDIHVPEHDMAAITAVVEFLKWYKPHAVVIIGDFMELQSVAHWEPKDAKPRRLSPEIKIGREILDLIDAAAGPQCVLKRFLLGNHEDWLNQYMIKRASEIYDGLKDLGIDLSIEGLLQLKERGYKVLPFNHILEVGNARFTHGFYTGRYHAKVHLDAFNASIYYGHVHDIQSMSSVTLKGTKEAMSLGCLRTLNAPFLKGKPNNWNHAFGIFEFRMDGNYTRYVPIIVDGQFSFNGKKFGG